MRCRRMSRLAVRSATTSRPMCWGASPRRWPNRSFSKKEGEAERDTIFNEYNHRMGEIVTAAVKRIELQDVIFDLGKAEARMPRREQSRLEQFSVGERGRGGL